MTTQPGYPAPGAPYAPPQRRTDGMSVAALVLGCLFWLPFAGAVCAILATIFGWIGLRHTREDSALSGHGMAVAGFVLGLIGLAIAGFIIVLIIIGIASTPTTSTSGLG